MQFLTLTLNKMLTFLWFIIRVGGVRVSFPCFDHLDPLVNDFRGKRLREFVGNLCMLLAHKDCFLEAFRKQSSFSKND